MNCIPDKQVDITEMENVKNSVDFGPFLTDGSVSLPDCDETVPVRILRDTGAGQSFLLEGQLDLMCWSEGLKWATWKFLYTAFNFIPSLLSGDVGVCDMLPIPGFTFILGIELPGGNVWENPDGGVPPILAPVVEGLNRSSDLQLVQ